jgi:DNA-binding winged helix-turn-helix (wHTH) protein
MSGQRIAFGPFVFNSEARTLVRQGLPVPVGYRGLLLLAAFLEHPGQVLTKASLMDAAWPGKAVEEGNLSVQIALLRKLLGPTSDGAELIATAQRVGYWFTAPVEQLEGAETPDELSSEPGPSIAVLAFANLSDDVEQEYFADGLAEDIITRLARLR